MGTPVVELPRRMNAATYFVDTHAEAGRGDDLAVVDAASGAEHTYGQVLQQVNRAGNALAGLGLRREDRVTLLLLDSPELVSCFFGAIKIGAVPIPTNTLLKPADYAYLLNDSRARVLVVHEELWPLVEPIRPQLRYLERVVMVGPGAGDSPDVIGHAELVGAASAELSPELMDRDDACFWLYSSGTTGFPKGAVHLQHDMIYAADLYAIPTLGIERQDRTFSVAKLFFAYGLGNGLYFPFRVGASTVLYPQKADAAAAFELIAQHRPSLFFSVPTGYAAMLAHDEAARRYDTSSLRLCISAGEALPAALYTRWQERFGVEILDGIGSTEILHIFISNRPGRAQPGSTGEIVEGYEASIVDEQGAEVPTGEVGDLLIKGDSTCSCYWNKHQQSKETIQGHWIRTGDKYSRDAAGYFWYQGRSDDMIKVGGIWVSPVEVEGALVQHPAVLESGVVGLENAQGLVKPTAFVVLKGAASAPRREALVGELQEFVKQRLAVYKYPRAIHFVDELPKTATGKIQRYKLRQ